MGGSRIGSHVLTQLINSAGTVVTVEDLAKRTEFSERQVRDSIAHMVSKGSLDIEVVIPGRAWKYHNRRVVAINRNAEATGNQPRLGPPTLSPGALLEVLGKMESGDLIARGDGERLYRVTPL